MGVDQARIDRADTGLGVHGVGVDSHLIAEQGNGIVPLILDRHGKECHGHLLAGGKQRIHFPFIGNTLHGKSQAGQTIRFSGHGRENDYHPVALLVVLDDPLSHRLNFIRGADRGPAEFLNNERHVLSPQ